MKSFGYQWHLTDRCNLRCAHCYQTQFDAATELGLDEHRRMADVVLEPLAEMGTNVDLNLTGGEPLLLPHLFELLEHLEGFQNLHEINVVTNGTRSGPELLDRLDSLTRLRFLKVSLESADQATNDLIRGQGNHERVARSIERYLTRHLDVILMVTLAASNVASIAQTIRWSRAMGLAGVIFERFVPLGRGKGLSHSTLTSAQWAEAVRAILVALGIEEPAVDDLAAFRAFWVELNRGDGDVLHGALCNLGSESMALMPTGTVYPCRRLPIPVVDDIRSQPFARVLDALQSWSVEPFRTQLHGELCTSCAIAGCGGCRALAFALEGDLYGDDPQCVLNADRRRR